MARRVATLCLSFPVQRAGTRVGRLGGVRLGIGEAVPTHVCHAGSLCCIMQVYMHQKYRSKLQPFRAPGSQWNCTCRCNCRFTKLQIAYSNAMYR